jgi:hypothetical protein
LVKEEYPQCEGERRERNALGIFYCKDSSNKERWLNLFFSAFVRREKRVALLPLLSSSCVAVT